LFVLATIAAIGESYADEHVFGDYTYHRVVDAFDDSVEKFIKTDSVSGESASLIVGLEVELESALDSHEMASTLYPKLVLVFNNHTFQGEPVEVLRKDIFGDVEFVSIHKVYVFYRVDKREVELLLGELAGDRGAIYVSLKQAPEFVEECKRGGQIRVRVEDDAAGTKTDAVFTLSGFTAAFSTLSGGATFYEKNVFMLDNE